MKKITIILLIISLLVPAVLCINCKTVQPIVIADIPAMDLSDDYADYSLYDNILKLVLYYNESEKWIEEMIAQIKEKVPYIDITQN